MRQASIRPSTSPILSQAKRLWRSRSNVMAAMEESLRRLVELQTRQNELLERYLWRIRFSLLTLLLLTTAICCGLGILVYQLRSTPRPVTIPAPWPSRAPTYAPPATPMQPRQITPPPDQPKIVPQRTIG